MAELHMHPNIKFTINLQITEGELKALDGIAGYGDDAFIKVFKEGLGESYIRDHKGDLCIFLRSVRDQAPGILKNIKTIKEDMLNMGNKNET
jgi:hypothetical protein